MKNTLQQHYGNRDRCFAEQYLPIHLPLEVQGTHMFNSPSLFLHRERRQEVQGTNGLPPHLMSPWAPRAAADLNILAVKFISNSSSMIHRFKQPGVEFPFMSVRYCDYELKQFARMAAESNGFVFSFFCRDLVRTFLKLFRRALGGMSPLYSHDSSPNASSSFTKLELAPESGGSTTSEWFCKELIEETWQLQVHEKDQYPSTLPTTKSKFSKVFISFNTFNDWYEISYTITNTLFRCLAFTDSFVMTEPLENADENAFMSPVSSTSSVHENQPPPIHLTWETNEAICSNHCQMPLSHEFLVLLSQPSADILNLKGYLQPTIFYNDPVSPPHPHPLQITKAAKRLEVSPTEQS
nr:beta-D-glucosyl crocetin beta-1,6-glucosyltransferase-like [Ipomoea trifida]